MSDDLLALIRQSLIGEGQHVPTCFGPKPLVYADYTASGRALSFVEDIIRERVLPYYANTHSETSYTGAHTSALREQSRDIIRTAINGSDDDAIIFCGSGATAAINKLLDLLNLTIPRDLDERYGLGESIPESQRPVVILGPYEHHSNELPWRESIARIEVVRLNTQGLLDMADLEERLQRHRDAPGLLASFSAASNVTGIKTDITQVTDLVHEYGGLCFWDYAAAAPYSAIDMNPEHSAAPDAVFISPHKFVGGPGSPGILVVKKHAVHNSVPAIPGGGTVSYVTPEHHRYLSNHEHREEGGTPAIVESIRAGLAFKLQQDVGTKRIENLEREFVQRAMQRWGDNENIDILGSLDADRLSILSLRIKRGELDLHYGFVVALLNDLFGIQARGGCSCAGPYGHHLLDMDMEQSRAIERQIEAGHMILRPGWARLNFNYFIDQDTFEYLLAAVELIAEHGWRLLPYYAWDVVAGSWRFQEIAQELPERLGCIDFRSVQTSGSDIEEETGGVVASLAAYLEAGREILLGDFEQQNSYFIELPAEAERLRWFVLPGDAETRQQEPDLDCPEAMLTQGDISDDLQAAI